MADGIVGCTNWAVIADATMRQRSAGASITTARASKNDQRNLSPSRSGPTTQGAVAVPEMPSGRKPLEPKGELSLL